MLLNLTFGLFLFQFQFGATAALSPNTTQHRRNFHIVPTTSSTYTPLSHARSSQLLRSRIASAACASSSVRLLSQESSPVALTTIPDAPVLPAAPISDTLVDGATTLASATVEPAFATLGLGGWSPIGIVQNCMEYLHVTLDIPWWGAIMIGTVCVRVIILPLVIMAQRNAAKMSNNMPQMQVLQIKMTEARQAGNPVESARYAQEMMSFMKSKDLNPLKNMIVPLAQAPVFVSFFIGLRQMANAPVESLRDGGLFWFTDLTMPDQFFLLPLLTSATLYLTIELGTDGAKLAAQNMQTMRYVLRAMPIIIFPFTMNFPGLILCYWACSNFISLVQVGILKIPAVRDLCKIERTITHPVELLPKKKGFVEGFQDCT